MKLALAGLALAACSAAPMQRPRVELDGAVCVMAAVQPVCESACDHRQLVDLDCYNPLVNLYRDPPPPPGYPHYCFGLRLPKAEAATYLAPVSSETPSPVYDIRDMCGP